MGKWQADKFKLKENTLEADCGIFFIDHTGNRHAVVKCPRYLSESQWEEYSSLIVRACNSHELSMDLLRRCMNVIQQGELSSDIKKMLHEMQG